MKCSRDNRPLRNNTTSKPFSLMASTTLLQTFIFRNVSSWLLSTAYTSRIEITLKTGNKTSTACRWFEILFTHSNIILLDNKNSFTSVSALNNSNARKPLLFTVRPFGNFRMQSRIELNTPHLTRTTRNVSFSAKRLISRVKAFAILFERLIWITSMINFTKSPWHKASITLSTW